MSAVLQTHAGAAGDVNSRLTFQKNLQIVTNKIHATSNVDEIMLEVSADICNLFNADRLTIYTVGEDKQTIVSKVKTGLNSFKDLKLPIAEHSIAGYVGLSKKMLNLRDVYDESELKSHNPNLRFLQEVDKRTGYRTKQMLVAPVGDQANNELIGVVQLINNKAGVPFGQLAEEGVTELCQTLAIAFKQRQKPQVLKTKYDFLVGDAVISAAEFELAARSARKKAVDVETVLTDEFQVKVPAGQVLWGSVRAVQARSHQAHGSSQEPEAGIRRIEPVGANRGCQGRPGHPVPGSGAHQEFEDRAERVPQGPTGLSSHYA